MRRLAISLLTIALAMGSWLYVNSLRAGVACTLPFNLQNNTTADATQVMANYNALVTCLGNAAAAGSNSDITALLGLLTPITPTAGGTPTFIGTASTGSANAQVIASTTPTGFSLTHGYTVVFLAGATNTASPTQINVNSTGLTTVTHPVPSAPGYEFLSGGEIVAGGMYAATYNSTSGYFEILSISNQLGGVGPSTNVTAASTTDLSTATNHNVTITGSTTINSFGSNADTNFPRYELNFTGAPTLTYNAVSMILPGGGNITATASDSAVAVYKGSGNWQIVNYTKVNGTAPVNPTPLPGFGRLTITNNAGTPTTQIDWSATLAVMVGPNSLQGSVPIYRANVSGTINLTNGTVTSTCNGMDGEVRGTSQWLYLYVIDNGTTTCGIASTAFSAPTFPAGYTYAAYAGAMRVDGSGNLLRTIQRGARAQYVLTGAGNAVNLPSMISGVSGSVSMPTWTSVGVANFIPALATSIDVILYTVAGGNGLLGAMAAPSNSYGAYTASANAPPLSSLINFATGGGTASNVNLRGEFVLELSGAVYYASNGAASGLLASGWVDTVNAN